MARVEIREREDANGVRVVDPVSGEQYLVETDRPVRPRASQADFPVPVSTTASVRAKTLVVETSVTAYLRQPDGEIAGTLSYGDRIERDGGDWVIELATPVKTYLRVAGPLELSGTEQDVTLRFSDTAEVVFGVRSKRRHPTETITTTDEPADIATTISHLGAAIQTSSPERSFPSLRDHPPAVRLGDDLSIPEGVTPPERGIELALPFEPAYLYAAAPVAFYLGARLHESSTPALRLETGETEPLPENADAFARRCRELLEQSVFLDCLARTEGLYPLDLRERARVEETLDLDWAALYDAPFLDRTAAYLDVPYEALEPHLPRWPAHAFVEPTADTVTVLPHLLDQLLPVTPCRPERLAGDEARNRALGQFLRPDEAVRSGANAVFDGNETFVELPGTSAATRLWYGEGVPLGGNSLHRTGIEAYHERRETDRSTITVTLVCNDSSMDAEFDDIDAIYGSRDRIPFEVEPHRNLTTDELADVLAAPHDFLHFVGHASQEGLHCPDGVLAPDSLDSVGVRTFFLNACSSYRPGVELVERGAVGGAVTTSDVTETNAESVGVMFARLLDNGFPLRIALLIARERSFVGGQYGCVGMDAASVTHPEGGATHVCELAPDGDEWTVTVTEYPSLHGNVGSVVTFSLGSEHMLTGNSMRVDGVEDGDLREFLDTESIPVKLDGEWCWSEDAIRQLGL